MSLSPSPALSYYDIITKYFPKDFKGFFIEVGMAEPIDKNNTYMLEIRGWKGLCIEPNERYCQMAQGVRENVICLACSHEDKDDVPFTIYTLIGDENEGACSSLVPDMRLIDAHRHMITRERTVHVKTRKLDTIIQEYEVSEIDLLSIDTENTEIDVLKGISLSKWRPRLIIVENNYEEKEVRDYLSSRGYQFVERYEVNDFFLSSLSSPQ